MGGIGLIFTPMLVRRLMGPPGLSRPMTSTFWTHSFSKLELGSTQNFKMVRYFIKYHSINNYHGI